MNIDEATKKVLFQVTMELPGYEQLLPRAQINLKYEIKKVLKAKDKEIKDAWEQYKLFLIEKYPPKRGEKFEFTCPHHKKIDSILKVF